MKSLSMAGWTVLLALILVTPADAGGNANLVGGGRTMTDENDWMPFQDQTVGGITVDFGPASWPFNLEAGAQGSEKTESLFGTDVTGRVEEVSFGLNKTWNMGRMHPYVGAGAAQVKATFESGSVSIDDSSAGFYVHGGIFWRLGRRFNIGFDVRGMGGTKISFFGFEGDANYTQGGLLLGWGWPASR